MINQCRFICFLLVIFLLEGSNSLIAQEALGKINCICIDAGHGGTEYICYKKDSNFSFKSIKIPLSYFSHLNFS